MSKLTLRRTDPEENFRPGLLIVFGAPLLKDGITRLINSTSLRVSAPRREKIP